MKPQALQDAIKARALKKTGGAGGGGLSPGGIKSKGEWKDPYVKKYKITAEDIEAEKRAKGIRGGGGISAPPMGGGGGGGGAGADILNALKMEVNAFKNDKAKLLQEMETMRKEMAAMRKEMNELREEKKKEKEPPSPAPHTAKELYDCQRKDKVLREYMTTKEGLFPAKYMTIENYEGNKLVCFKRRLYIPAKLRKKTMEHYSKVNVKSVDAKAALKRNCIWPDLETDWMPYDK